MKNAVLIIIVVSIIILGGGVYLLTRGQKGNESQNQTTTGGYQLFWSSTCPHCKNVDEFLNTRDKKDQVTINKIQVDNNNQNAQKLIQAGYTCKLDNRDVGTVPLLVTPDGQCLLGDTPIIDYFKSL